MFDLKTIPSMPSYRKSGKVSKDRNGGFREESYIGRMVSQSRNNLYEDFVKQNRVPFYKSANRSSEILGAQRLAKCRQMYQTAIKNLNQNYDTLRIRDNYLNNSESYKHHAEKGPFYEPRRVLRTNDLGTQRYKPSNTILRSNFLSGGAQTRTPEIQSNLTLGIQRRGQWSKGVITRPKLKTSKQSQTTSSKSTIQYECHSIKGSKPINQDTIKVGDNIWIVCDGHGEYGHEISHYVANLLQHLLTEHSQNQTISPFLFQKLFTQTEKCLQQSGIDINLSGCTCVTIVCDDDKIYCASVGDSVAIAVYQNGGYQTISSEHKPGNVQEAQRIGFCGGQVKKSLGKEHVSGSPLRLWGQGGESWGPGLAVSRAFGDKMGQRYGLIYQPEVKCIPITKSLRHIVMGSDGLFDQILPGEMVNILPMQNRKGTCKMISEIAESRWVGYADDISAIILNF